MKTLWEGRGDVMGMSCESRMKVVVGSWEESLDGRGKVAGK